MGSSFVLYQYVMYTTCVESASRSILFFPLKLTVSGMNPPINRPRRQRQAKYPALLVKAACEAEMIDHPVMMKGMKISAPSFFEIRPEGSSAARNDSRKMVCPVLKSFVVIPSSGNMSSEMARLMLRRFRSNATNMSQHHVMILRSIW